MPVSINSVNPEMIGEYTTKYDAKIKRATNVSLASASINGTIVMPNEIFSYTKTVGPRTTARGYVEAPIYTNGQVGKGIGGGICQVSSTLYACLKASLFGIGLGGSAYITQQLKDMHILFQYIMYQVVGMQQFQELH